MRPTSGIKVVNLDSAHQIKTSENDNNALDKLCTPCIGSKSTQVV